MRIKLIIIFFFCGIAAKAQIYTPVNPTVYGEYFNRIKSQFVLHLPMKDTILNTADTTAQIFYRPTDSSVWAYSKAKRYFKIGVAGAGGGSVSLATTSTPGIVQIGAGLTITGGVLATNLGLFKQYSVPYAGPSGLLIQDTIGLYYDGVSLHVGNGGFFTTSGLILNAGRGQITASGFGITLATQGGTPYDLSKHFFFYNGYFRASHWDLYMPSGQFVYTSADKFQFYWNGDLVPDSASKYDVGYLSQKWNRIIGVKGYFDSVFIGGAYFNPITGGGGGGSGTVNNGSPNTLAYYATTGTTVSSMAALAPSFALKTDANGLPTTGTVTEVELEYLNGVTANIQTQLNGKANVGTILTSHLIYGNAYDGTADVTAIIGSAFGGTANGFTKFSGPTTSEKTFTLPNASSTILTTNAAVTTGQGGTNITTYTTGDIIYASASNVLSKLPISTNGRKLVIKAGIPFWGDTTAIVSSLAAMSTLVHDSLSANTQYFDTTNDNLTTKMIRYVSPGYLVVRTLVAGSNITLSVNYDSITIASTGGAGLAIGNTVTSGVSGSILFVDAVSHLNQSSALFFNEANSRLEINGITSTSSSAKLVVTNASGNQVKLQYDTSNYAGFVVGSSGKLSITSTGNYTSMNDTVHFSKGIDLPSNTPYVGDTTNNKPLEVNLTTGAVRRGSWSGTGSGGSSYTFSTGLTNASSTITANLVTGIAGGGQVVGGTASADTLRIMSTTNATKGIIWIGASKYNEATDVYSGAGNITALTQIAGSVNVSSTVSYRTTNAGSGITPGIWTGSNSSSAGTMYLGLDQTTGRIAFIAGNGTNKVSRAAIGITNLVNTSTAESADMIFMTQSAGAVMAEHLRLDKSGNLELNTTATGASSVGVFTVGVATAIPTGNATDAVILYAEGANAELKVRDELANITVLSPHNFSGIPGGPSEEMAWSYYSERNGKFINVDMLRLARLVEKLTGEKLVYEGSKN